MRRYLVNFEILLNNDADTRFIEDVIYENLEKNEDIIKINIKELPND